MSMIAVFCEWEGKIYFLLQKFGDLYVQNMSCVPPDYMRSQLEIKENMRGILIDWLIEVQVCSYAGSICCHALDLEEGYMGCFLDSTSKFYRCI